MITPHARFRFFWALLLLAAPSAVLAGGPTLQHQPPTGLTTGTPNTDMRPDGSGGTKITQTSSDSKTDGATTTTTTVTRTRTLHKDGTVTDETVTETESLTKGTGKDGGEYVKQKTNQTTTTTRETDQAGNTDTSSSTSGRAVDFNEPGEGGTPSVKSSKFGSKESLKTNGKTGMTKHSYVDDDGSPVTVTTIPGQVKSTRTKTSSGAVIVNDKTDGTRSIIVLDGKERTQDWYDKDGNKVRSEHRDKKGRTTRRYKDEDGNQVTDKLDKEGRMSGKKVVQPDGSYYIIKYLMGKPFKLIEYDKDGKKRGEEIIRPEDRKDFNDMFGDATGTSSPFEGPSIGSEVLVTGGQPAGGQMERMDYET